MKTWRILSVLFLVVTLLGMATPAYAGDGRDREPREPRETVNKPDCAVAFPVKVKMFEDGYEFYRLNQRTDPVFIGVGQFSVSPNGSEFLYVDPYTQDLVRENKYRREKFLQPDPFLTLMHGKETVQFSPLRATNAVWVSSTEIIYTDPDNGWHKIDLVTGYIDTVDWAPDGVPAAASPGGRYIAVLDKDQKLSIFDRYTLSVANPGVVVLAVFYWGPEGILYWGPEGSSVLKFDSGGTDKPRIEKASMAYNIFKVNKACSNLYVKEIEEKISYWFWGAGWWGPQDPLRQ